MPVTPLATLLAALLLWPAAAAAQEAPPPQSDPQPIVVTGNRTPDREITDFVAAFTIRPNGGPIPRFSAICPLAVGPTPDQKATVVARVRAVAKAAGIAVAGDRCSPNVLVIVTADRLALLEALGRSHREYFYGLTRAEHRALLVPGLPAVAWHIPGAPLDPDGKALVNDPYRGPTINRTTRPGSRIGVVSRPQFAAAIVVIESRALTGLTTTQLADYAAMRTLIEADPAHLAKSGVPTILKVLDTPMGGEAPVTLTAWDLGVLRALYASAPKESIMAQRADLRGRLKREVHWKGAR